MLTKNNFYDALIAPLSLLVVLVALLQYTGESLVSNSAISLYLIVFFIAIIPGIFLIFFDIRLKVFTISFILIAFFYAFYFYPIDKLDLPFGNVTNFILIFLVVLFLSWLFKSRLSEILVVFFSVLLISTVFLRNDASTSSFSLNKDNTTATNQRINFKESMPRYIHIILDAHIGIEGMLVDTEKNKKYVNLLTQKYLNNGFDVYGGAFTKFWHTNQSIPSIFNFNLDEKSFNIHGKEYWGDDNRMIDNKLFELLQNQGYSINIYETDWLKLCDNPKKLKIKKCVKYSAGLLFNKDESIRGKILITLNEIAARYRLVSAWNILHLSELGKALSVPFWPFSVSKGDRFGTASLKILKQLEDDIIKSSGGEAFIAHILLPHDPYIFDENCNVVVPNTYKNRKNIRNYRMYLAQLKCTQKKVISLIESLEKQNILRNSIVVVHSDHGPGLSEKYGNNYNKIDYHSSFYAEHVPNNEKGAYYTQNKPIAILLRRLYNEIFEQKYTVSHNSEDLSVYNYFVRIPFKPFKNGEILDHKNGGID